MIGVYTIGFGVLLLALAFRLRGLPYRFQEMAAWNGPAAVEALTWARWG